MANFLKSLFIKGVEIDTASATTGNSLIYNGTKFAPATPGTGSIALDGLSDVVITTPLEFQTLEYNGTNWVNTNSPSSVYVRNAEATTITTGTCVYLFGATGDHATVKRADHNSDATSAKTVGVVSANILASQNGVVVTQGYVDGIDLSTGYTAGDVLWLGEAGAFTKTKPTAPDHLVFIGVVVRATNNGIIYVATQNGYELDELHNVSLPSPQSGEFLKYNGSLWVADAIDLGTDTTGNYMSGISGTSPVSVAHTAGEGSSATVSLAASYGDTQNPYASKTANHVLAAPNGTAGVPTFRAIVAADIPTLNQNTTGTAATVTGAAQTAITSLGTLTALTVSGNLTVDTSTLFVDSTNNRVGIGTASPNSALHVFSGALGGTAGDELIATQVRATNSNQDIIYTKYRRVSTGADWTTAQAKIQRTIYATDMGYVAFGGTAAFDVRIGSGTTDIATFASNGTIVTTSTAAAKVLVVKGTASQSGDFIDIQNSGGTSQFKVTSAGDVHIGTANNYGKVNIAGSAAIHHATPLLNLVNASNTRLGYLYHDATNLQLLNHSASGGIQLATNSVNRLNINSAGEVGIASSPITDIRLTVTGGSTNSANPVLILNGVSGSGALNLFNDMGAGSYNEIVTAGAKGIIATGANSTTTRGALVIAPWSSDVYGIRFTGGSTTDILVRGTSTFTPSLAANKALIIKGVDSQAGDFFDVQNSGGTSQFKVDSSGNLLLGATSRRSVGGAFQPGSFNSFFNEQGNGLTPFTSVLNRNDSNGLRFVLGKSRGTAAGAVTALVANDSIAEFHFAGADGTTLDPLAARIMAHVDGAVATGSVPGRLSFATNPVAGTNPVERMRITNAGLVGIATTAPVAKLEVLGSDTVSSQANVSGVFGTTTSGRLLLGSITGNTPFIGSEGATTLAFTTNSTVQMRITSDGNVGINAVPSAFAKVHIGGTLPSSSNLTQVFRSVGTIPSTSTSGVWGYLSAITTQAASFTVTNLFHFSAEPGAKGAGSTITNQYGFFANSVLTGATNNYGFYGDITSDTGRWNLFMAGNANNYMAGRLGIGATLTSGAMAQVVNTTAGDKALIVKGAASQSGSLLEVQNSGGTALVTIDSAGNVGIGTTTPDTALDVIGTTTLKTVKAGSGTVAISSASYSSTYGTTNYNTSTPHNFNDGDTVAVTGITPSSFNRTATAYVANSTQFYFLSFNGSTGGAYSSGGTASGPPSTLYVDATNDRIGIGTSSPATKLDVVGTITATTYTGALASAVTATTQTAGDNSTKVATTAFVIANAAAAPKTLRSVTASTDTPTSADNGYLLTINTTSGAVTITINSSLGLTAGQSIDFMWVGAATSVTFSASSVTLNGTPGLKLRARYSAATLMCTASNTYVLIGDLSA